MVICKFEGCENCVEGSTEFCATHNLMLRKQAREALKEKKFYRIPPMSKKMAKEVKKYSGPNGTREKHLRENPNCQIKLIGCQGVATQVHHSAKRGKNMNNVETFMSACDHCHVIVETKLSAAERREKGFLK